jgi:RNA polymerase sigma-70 factor (ECF subfamily)
MQPSVAHRRLIEENVPLLELPTYRKLSDLTLVRRAREGDRRALDALVERHSPRVNRLAAQLLGDLEDARDAAQESLVKLCTRLRQFREEAQFATWLHRLVVNTCRDVAARKLARPSEPLVLEERMGDDDGDLSRIAMLGDLRRDLADALGRLSAEQRVAVLLRDALDLSYDEIARRARMPVGTVKCYVHRGHERLRTRLQELAAG